MKNNAVKNNAVGKRTSLRIGDAPRTLASLRDIVISLLRISGIEKITAALRHNARDHHRALALLGLT